MLRKKFTFGLIAAAAAMALPGTAQAATLITAADVGKSFVVDFNGTNDGGTIAGLSGLLTVKIESFLPSSVVFSYSIKNDSISTNPNFLTASTISGFGFDTNPDIDSATASGVFANANTGNIAQVGKVEFCVTNSNACSGGAGVLLGQTGFGGFTLNFASSITQLSLDNFAIRYQAIAGTDLPSDSWSGTGSSGNPNLPPPAVPEPATWMMMLLGFGLIGASMRHRKGIAFRAQFA